MSSEKLKIVLKETNPWWKNPHYSLTDYKERAVYNEIVRFLPTRQIIALTGLRRTGKTTILLKTISEYLKTYSPSSILYFSFDDFFNCELQDLLTAYHDLFPASEFQSTPSLFCFDEIQKLENWQEKIKRLYDTFPHIKIIISGSESLFIRKHMKETLAGRIFEFTVHPLTFQEYLAFIGKGTYQHNISLYSSELRELYRKFMICSGFPELVPIDDTFIMYKYLKESIVDKIIFKDIPQLFHIKKSALLTDLLDIILFSPGQILDTVKLGKELKVSRQVIAQYLTYLEQAFCIKKVYNYSGNIRKQKRSLKKYYPVILYPQIVEDQFSIAFETSVMIQLHAEFFWRDTSKNEVDAVDVSDKNKPLPIEIKSGKVSVKGMYRFMNKFKCTHGLILTPNTFDRIDNITIMPAFSYFLPEKED